MREPRKVRRLRAQLDLAAGYIARQEETMAVVRDELHRLQAQVRRLEAALENARAETQTQAAFLREGYRSKTGEIL